MADTKNVYQRLLAVQHELKAPRQAGGRFGKARNAEQILEAAKPVCFAHGLLLQTSDLVHEVNGRTYVTATARVFNVDKPEEIVEADANAWEGDISRGLDAPQVTGAASSYAKKYALQNLFAIDDSKEDPDYGEPATKAKGHTDNVKQVFPDAEVAYASKSAVTAVDGTDKPPTEVQLERIREIRAELGYPSSQTETKIKLLKTQAQAGAAVGKLKAELDAANVQGGE